MKVKVLPEVLMDALDRIVRILPSKALVAGEDHVHFSTLGPAEMMISCHTPPYAVNIVIPMEAEVQGAAFVPGKVIHEWVKMAASDVTELEWLGETYTLKATSGRDVIHLKGRNPSDFKHGPVVKSEAFFEMRAEDWKQMLQSVAIAVATEDSHPVLRGVFFQADSTHNEVRAVAADGYSLHTCLYNASASSNFDVTVPEEALRLLKPTEGEPVRVTVLHDKVMISDFKSVVVTLAIEGKFPDFARILRARGKGDHAFRIEAQQLKDGLKLVEVFSKDNNRITSFSMTPSMKYDEPSKLGLKASNVERGNAEHLIDCASDGTEPFRFNASSRLFLRAISALPKDAEIEVRGDGPEMPVYLYHEDLQIVIMPMSK